jgi:RNA polymerase sigma-70 factor, ECF subfamily
MRAPGPRGRPRAETLVSDEAMVARAMAGDRRAFDELYQRHVDSVWRWLTRLLGADPEREDLAQHIFSEVFDTLGRFRGQARFRTFLYRIVVNVAVDQMKRRTRRAKRDVAATLAEAVPDPARSPEENAETRELVAGAFELLERIKPKKRVAFLLRVVEGLSLEEVADVVAASVPTVAQRVRHASIELRALRARRDGRSAERLKSRIWPTTGRASKRSCRPFGPSNTGWTRSRVPASGLGWRTAWTFVPSRARAEGPAGPGSRPRRRGGCCRPRRRRWRPGSPLRAGSAGRQIGRSLPPPPGLSTAWKSRQAGGYARAWAAPT